MAQNEDTELRDLVIEALEKNGSMAKIRALLRANVFLAFENECENIKHNICIDNILKKPEGLLTLSLVHEFLEFCNLKNTLFVYKAETRQGKEYTYPGTKKLKENLNINHDRFNEPLLLTIVRNVTTLYHRRLYEHKGHGDGSKSKQNRTYVLPEEGSNSSNQSISQSDQSSDDKNKLHLRLPLDNSDTDTSSDSTREKSSEYIPNENIIINEESEDDKSNTTEHSSNNNSGKDFYNSDKDSKDNESIKYQPTDITANHSSESTSYMDLKPIKHFGEKVSNVSQPALSIQETNLSADVVKQTKQQSQQTKVDSLSPIISNNSLKSNNDEINDDLGKSEETPEYTYDFSSISMSKARDKDIEQNTPSQHGPSPETSTKEPIIESPHQNSQSSRSSVSISDVADLVELSENISPKSNSYKQRKSTDSSKNYKLSLSIKSRNELNKLSDDSGDYSESPIPSLSNLSLDFHSD